jgi:hypothetical protein
MLLFLKNNSRQADKECGLKLAFLRKNQACQISGRQSP